MNNTKQNQQNNQRNTGCQKMAITSSVILTLITVFIILFILIGPKTCKGKNNNSNSASSITPSSIPFDYDEHDLNYKFRAIVSAYQTGPGLFGPDYLEKVNAVTYVDNYESGTFSLYISATSDHNKVYVYEGKDIPYPEDKSRFNNLVEYLLLDDTPDLFKNGSEFTFNRFDVSDETITTEKQCKYVITTSGENKYIEGFYLNNETKAFHIYLHQQINDDHPFDKQASQITNTNEPIYKYYQYLLGI